LIQFGLSILKLRKFSPFNQLLLSLFDVSNRCHDSFLTNVEAKMCQTV